MGVWHVAATLCGFVSLVLLLTALGSDHWLEVNSGQAVSSLGLWKLCLYDSGSTGCASLGMHVDDFIHSTRAFLILAVFPGFIACALLLVLFARSEIGSFSIILILQISSFVAGGFALLALIIFTGAYGSGTYGSTLSYGWSPIVGWVGAALFLVTGLLAFKARTYEQN